jgi:hypothetical protein
LAGKTGKFFPYSGSGVLQEKAVPAITTNGLLRNLDLPHFDLAKLDIEGAEGEVFRETSWLRGMRELIVETHGEAYLPVMKALVAEGFRTHVYNEKNLIANSVLSLFRHPINLLRAEAYSRLTALRHLLSYKRRPPTIIDKSNPWLRLIYAKRRTA